MNSSATSSGAVPSIISATAIAFVPRCAETVSGTVVRDEVEYAFPLGPLGDVANALGGRMQIRALFAHRQKMLLKLLGHARP